MDRYLMVLAGAAAGGLARYVISAAVMQRVAGRFPLGTLVVNVTGCFLIGVLMSLFIERGAPHPNLRLLLVTGVLGGYTTFSAFAWESFEAMEEGSFGIGLVNLAGSVVLGYLAVWCGVWLVRR
jgi:CrcB protein